MDHFESLEDFYKRKVKWIPDQLRQEIGHFNVFKVEPVELGGIRPSPYKRRDYYKVTLAIGDSDMEYADKVLRVKKQALVFSNPMIPYRWTHLENIESGYFCIFNQAFFHQFGVLGQYAVFQPGGMPVFELTDEQTQKVLGIFERIVEEINSEYVHKYDVLRNLVFELVHFALKLNPAATQDRQLPNASQRITSLFLELLERQFPIEEAHPRMKCRTPSDFAAQLSVHTNHLNRAVKANTQKTTSQLIAERILQEAKILLRHSTWNVAEIAYALGFTEVTHFNHFFKNRMLVSPLKYRNHPN